MKNFLPPFLCCLLCLLTACSSLSVNQMPDVAAIPPEWQQLSVGNKTLERTARVLDPALVAVQEQALRTSPTVLVAALRWTRARQASADAGLDRQPQFGLKLEACRGSPRDAGTCAADVLLSARAGYEVDLWSRLRNTELARFADAAARSNDLEAARRLIRSDVTEQYWALGAIGKLVRLTELQLQDAQDFQAVIEAKVRHGAALAQQVDAAASQLETVRGRLAALRRERVEREQVMRILLGSSAIPILAQAALPQGTPDGLDEVGTPAAVLERRPDVQSARRGVDAVLARLRVANAARYPTLSLDTGAIAGAGGHWIGQPVATLVAGLVVPLVEWRRLQLRSEASRTDLEIAAVALRDTVVRALAEIEALAARRKELRFQRAVRAQFLQKATRGEHSARARVASGTLSRGDWLLASGTLSRGDWLLARGSLHAAQADSVALRLAEWRSILALQRALALD